MICDIIDFTVRKTPLKMRYNFSQLTPSTNSSSNSSFEGTLLKIPKPLLSSDEKFEASLCAFEFRLLVPELESVQNYRQLTQELEVDKYTSQSFCSLEIAEENIIKDERTTLMLKNIPKYMRPCDLRTILNKEFRNQFDFLYLPSDNNNEGNLGYAFVNFQSSEIVLKFFKKYNNNRWIFNDKSTCQLKYAKLQGRRDLMNQINE